ncbi:hypothetical protein acdb102_05880 [Acidothermaceae bacterium B102]|nr:hypothetical protein acdb102_05880 [Acidothermaceae bacterium B102]
MLTVRNVVCHDSTLSLTTAGSNRSCSGRPILASPFVSTGTDVPDIWYETGRRPTPTTKT